MEKNKKPSSLKVREENTGTMNLLSAHVQNFHF